MGGATECEVAIAGGGPTGLMLAGELALAGVDVAVLEGRPGPELVGSRAGGLHIRTLEILDGRGIAERFIEAGTRHPAVMFAEGAIAVGDTPTRFPFTLGLYQREIERLLREWVVDELGVEVRYGREVVGFEEVDGGGRGGRVARDGGPRDGRSGEGGVEVRLADGGARGGGVEVRLADGGARGGGPHDFGGEGGVEVRLGDGGTVRAAYLVGCDGGRARL